MAPRGRPRGRRKRRSLKKQQNASAPRSACAATQELLLRVQNPWGARSGERSPADQRPPGFTFAVHQVLFLRVRESSSARGYLLKQHLQPAAAAVFPAPQRSKERQRQ